ncbi:flagellin protein [Clostridium sp. CAG:221]|uniref:flagellin N-terminal helical domain-containing protein n=1 Tax=Clostridium sp. CAG:221 TaxID=1262780 RepID=UPI000337A019|nr:flagellin [Clostridium sp. CAG:221]CDB14790.1 flagellin protein [Clostridium sp. CAG:221]
MIINHNMNALNAHRNMNVNNTAAGKSMEKLSSGLRINRAGDDAAGLAISEKMRGQIRGLTQASRNASDGISMIQTAEGALNETQNILQRMRELSVQSSNDTNTSADRASIQKEIEQLTEEIDRIGNNTEFNTQSLLKGDGSTKLEGVGIAMQDMVPGADETTIEAKLELTVSSGTADTKATIKLNGQEIKVDVTQKGANGQTEKNEIARELADQIQQEIEKNSSLKDQYKVSVSNEKVTIEAIKGGKYEGSQGTIEVGKTNNNATNLKNNNTDINNITNTGVTNAAKGASIKLDLTGLGTAAPTGDLNGKGITIGKTQIEFYNAKEGAYSGKAIGVDINGVDDADKLATAIFNQTQGKLEGATIELEAGFGLTVKSLDKGANSTVNVQDGAKNEGFEATFQVGANSNQTISISIGDMRAEALGVKNVDLKTAEGSQEATATIQAAIEKVSTERAGLGAVQNRLEYTISNLDNTTENLTSAESTLRDVDMAKEMMTFSKNNILNQAAQAMLAQANQQPQNVLSLLR